MRFDHRLFWITPVLFSFEVWGLGSTNKTPSKYLLDMQITAKKNVHAGRHETRYLFAAKCTRFLEHRLNLDMLVMILL